MIAYRGKETYGSLKKQLMISVNIFIDVSEVDYQRRGSLLNRKENDKILSKENDKIISIVDK